MPKTDGQLIADAIHELARAIREVAAEMAGDSIDEEIEETYMDGKRKQ